MRGTIYSPFATTKVAFQLVKVCSRAETYQAGAQYKIYDGCSQKYHGVMRWGGHDVAILAARTTERNRRTANC